MSTGGQLPRLAALAALAALDDPLDRACFDLIASSDSAVGRDEVAERLGLPRASAAFRLDRLAGAGLLATEYRRLSGRTGPGAGRPAKLYRAAVTEVTASVPERHYELAADVLATVLDGSRDDDAALRSRLASAAFERGVGIGRSAASLDEALEHGGYEPVQDGPWQRLMNCPFHRLARAHTATVCALNHALLQGVLEGCGDDPERAEFAPDPSGCCVRVRQPEP